MFIYDIDGSDRIVSVNNDWMKFALENNFNKNELDQIIGRILWVYIENHAVRHLYKMLFDRVRGGAYISNLPYRCDAPDCRRFMEMDLSRTEANEVRIESRIVKQEYREPIPLLSDLRNMSDEIIVICSFCKKIRVNEASWVEVEEGMKLLKLTEAYPLPQLSHSICDECYAKWEAQMDD